MGKNYLLPPPPPPLDREDPELPDDELPDDMPDELERPEDELTLLLLPLLR